MGAKAISNKLGSDSQCWVDVVTRGLSKLLLPIGAQTCCTDVSTDYK
jgi:hypothetical protein